MLQEASVSTSLHSYLLEGRTRWNFIPERAPHFGGLWESAVRATKLHLKKVMGEQLLNYEEMATVASQVEACLNSRPLGQLYCHSPDAVAPLPPAHFLIGRSMTAYPEAAITRKLTLTRRWMLCQAPVQSWWKRWQVEYLQQLQARQRWRTPQPNLVEDELVLLTDSNQFQEHWTLARVTALYPGEDGLVRAVDVRVCRATPPSSKQTSGSSSPAVKTTVLRRPVVRLFPEEDQLTDEIDPEAAIASSGGGCSGLDP